MFLDSLVGPCLNECMPRSIWCNVCMQRLMFGVGGDEEQERGCSSV